MKKPARDPDNAVPKPRFFLLSTGAPYCLSGLQAQPQELKHNDGALIAVLVLDGARPRSALGALFWPESTLQKRSRNISQRGLRLKAMAGAPVINTGGPSIAMYSDLTVDVDEVSEMSNDELLSTPGLLAGHDPGPLEELADWLREARERVADLLVEEIMRRAAGLEKNSDFKGALAMARKAVALNKFSESGWHQQMRFHYLLDDRAMALELYGRMSTLWKEVYDAPLSDEIEELHQILLIESRPAGKRRSIPDSVLRPPVLIGRRSEWSSMSAAWQSSQPFLLVGEAGIGKSRLLEDYLRGESSVVKVQTPPGDRSSPNALLGRLLMDIERVFHPNCDTQVRNELARIRPELGVQPSVPFNTAISRYALETWFASAMTSGLRAIVVDDLHDADEASLEALRWLSASAALCDLRMGFAARSIQSGVRTSVLATWLLDSRRPVQITLKPLSSKELLEFLSSLMLTELVDKRVVDQLFRHTGGHPLYTLAMLQHALVNDVTLDECDRLPMPDSVQALLDARVRDLPAHTRQLVQVLAVGGEDLSVDRAALVLECSPLELSEAWAVLEAANVLRGEAFSHGLVHEAALRTVATGVQQSLHRKWAAVLTSDGRALPGRVAMHWEAGQCMAEAGSAWHAAGVAARRTGRLIEQHDFFVRASRCSLAGGDRDAAFESAFARLGGMQLREGGAAVIEALEGVRSLADTTLQRLRCRIAGTEALLAQGPSQATQAVKEASEAIDEARAHPEQMSEAQAMFGIALAQSNRLDEALPVALEALRGARATGEPVKVLRAANGLMYVHWSAGRLTEALAVQREELECAEQLGDRVIIAASQGSLAALLSSAGDVPGTYLHATQAGIGHRQTGLAENSPQLILNHTVLGAAAAALGRFNEAIQALERAVELAGPLSAADVRGKACVTLAGVWLTLGRPDQCLAVARVVPASAPPGMQMQAAWLMAYASEMNGAEPEHHWARFDRLASAFRGLTLTQGVEFEVSYRPGAVDSIMQLAAAKEKCALLGMHGLARTLGWRLLALQMELPAGTVPEAEMTASALELENHAEQGLSAKAYPPAVWLCLSKFFSDRGDDARSQACQDCARRWISAALESMNPQWRTAFSRRNPVNLALSREKR